jgi:hypothetical protein
MGRNTYLPSTLFIDGPVYLALFEIVSAIIDRLIDVLAVYVGDEALLERF